MLPIAASIPAEVVRENVERLRDLMRREDLAAVIVFHPSNMLAFVGTPHSSSDRLTCAAVTRDAGVHVICPAFERPALADIEPHVTLRTWEESENPYRIFAEHLESVGVAKAAIGVDGRIWLKAWYRLCQALPQAGLRIAESLLREVRICKSEQVQDILRRAHRNGERFFLELRSLVRPGVSEQELYEEVTSHLRADGLQPDAMIQSGPNGAVPHNPTGQRRLQEGDLVVVDSVLATDGFFNDLTRTYAVGEPPQRARQAYETVRRAQAAAIEAARPGVACGELDRIARRIIEEAGFGPYFTHRLGHGIGIEVHEPPYLCPGNPEPLRPGMCVTIEPGIYVPGEFGVRIEDDVLITADGCEVIRGDLPTDVSPPFAD